MQHPVANLALALTAALALGLGGLAEAAAPPAPSMTTTGARLPGCRDVTGKFVPCPTKPAAKVQCRDKTTKKLAKCGAPNTEPLPAKAAAGATPKTAAKPN